MSSLSSPGPWRMSLGAFLGTRPALAISVVLGLQYLVFLALLTVLARTA